jgi:hypothetical protein
MTQPIPKRSDYIKCDTTFHPMGYETVYPVTLMDDGMWIIHHDVPLDVTPGKWPKLPRGCDFFVVKR